MKLFVEDFSSLSLKGGGLMSICGNSVGSHVDIENIVEKVLTKKSTFLQATGNVVIS